MKQLLLWAIASLLLPACIHKPEPLHYGTDECDFCRMTIVDPQHGAELITAKGKIFKFDAIECMVHYVQKNEGNSFESFWVNEYGTTTGALVDASTCTFLISKNIPSPMGAFLSGFSDPTTAEKFKAEKGGETFGWEALLDRDL